MRVDDLTNPELVTLAVGLLGGDVAYVDREDVAVRVNDIAPGRFGWRKYPERIDLDAVGVALRDAKKAKNGGLIVGSNKWGWMLSAAGSKWVRSLEVDAVEDAHSIKHRKASISANQEAERARLRNTRAYKLFIDGEVEAITLQDFYQFARVNEYFQSRTRERRCRVIANAVADDETLYEVWDFLEKRFGEGMR